MQTTCDYYGEKIKLSDIRTNVVRLSHECLATVARMKMKLKLQLWELHETLSRMSHTTVARYGEKIKLSDIERIL